MPRKRQSPIPPEIKRVGASIKRIRKKLKMTQEEFAEHVSIHPRVLQSLEEGSDFKISTLLKLVNSLDLESIEILGF